MGKNLIYEQWSENWKPRFQYPDETNMKDDLEEWVASVLTVFYICNTACGTSIVAVDLSKALLHIKRHDAQNQYQY